MEKTLDKARFFAQYFGQRVHQFVDDLKYMSEDRSSTRKEYTRPFVDEVFMDAISDKREGILLLKPLSSISDEDKAELNKFRNWLPEHGTKVFYMDEADYLRSKGYALPYMQYSVEDLVNMGWIKLTS